MEQSICDNILYIIIKLRKVFIMKSLKEKFADISKKIKIAMKIKNIYSFVMGKVAIITAALTIKQAIEEAWESSKAKRM